MRRYVRRSLIENLTNSKDKDNININNNNNNNNISIINNDSEEFDPETDYDTCLTLFFQC